MFMFLALVAAQAAPSASLPSVFGLQLGAPLTLPECAHADLGRGVRSPDVYDDTGNAICQHLPGKEVASDPDRGAIYFPLAKMPLIVSFNVVDTIVINGALQGVWAATWGYSNAAVITDQLTKKFGPPSSKSAETVTSHGIPVPGNVVIWERPEYRVEYHTMGENVAYGWLRVETKLAQSQREAREHEVDSQRTPL